MIGKVLRALGWGRFSPPVFVLFAAVLVIGASAAALVVVYRTGERIILERERAETLAERDLLEEVAYEQGIPTVTTSVQRRVRFAAGGEHYGLFAANGRALAGDLPAFQPGFREADWKLVRVRKPPKGAARMTLHVVSAILPGDVSLVVARDQSNLRQFERSIIYGFLAALAIVVVAALLAGFVMNALILRRVDAIAATAERIAAGDLSARSPVVDRHDPFGRVGASLNGMLERIEALMTGMRTVTDSLAHDLRSPLTRMKGALARALHPDATEPERLDAIEAAHGEIDRTLATLSAMLDIARAESGLSRDMMQAVDLGLLMADVVEVFAPTLEDAGQSVQFTPPALPVIALAHETLVRQAVGNLLYNASLYAGSGATVTASVEEAGDTIRLVVADTGPGIPADQAGRVQERFVRLDPARTTQGSGLGLAIAAACAKLHGGVLLIEDNHPGVKAVLEISRA